jgi:dTDP-4-dehydrorhamnose reductase
MKVLVAGGAGQLGRALAHTAPLDLQVQALARAEFDLENSLQVTAVISAQKPDLIINAAAYTAVDRAESESDTAHRVNGSAVADLAQACAKRGVRLIHVSTDYVFDGQTNRAIEPDAPTHPLNVYGASKLAGERAIQATTNLDSTVVRASWVYAPWGNNFLLTMLRLMRERGGVSVVRDQIGAPLSALSLARFLWRAAVNKPTAKILHCADAGVASWYDFAVAIAEEAFMLGLLKQAPPVKSISTAEYPTAAKRPAFSLLATQSSMEALGIEQRHWRVALREVLGELKST